MEVLDYTIRTHYTHHDRSGNYAAALWKLDDVG